MSLLHTSLNGAGLGLRRPLLTDILQHPPENVDFYEIAPENWITIGGSVCLSN